MPILSQTTINNAKCVLASRVFYEFCKLKAPNFYSGVSYLEEICTALQDFLADENELLIINMPPRHGKSRTAGLFVQWALGNNNRLKIIAASYNEKLSQAFSKATRNGIQEEKIDSKCIVYSDIFPNTNIERGSARIDLWKLERSDEHNYLATSPNATITGFGADIVIIDDIIKDSYEAHHAGIMQDHFDWFTDTLYSRLEGMAKVILIMTRWASKDLAGRLIEMYTEQGRNYRLISKRAFDGKEMLNDKVLPLLRYENLIRTIGEEIVQANYNQVPIDIKGMLYSEFMTYSELPSSAYAQRLAICDPADGGGDYLCMISYVLIGNFAYVIDVYYTKDGGVITDKEIAQRLKRHKIQILYYENNFAGSAMRRNILKECAAIGYGNVGVTEFTQTKNKQARIFAFASMATKYIYMPEGWNHFYPNFYKEITEYQREGVNAHDDGCDVITMIAERIAKRIEPYAK